MLRVGRPELVIGAAIPWPVKSTVENRPGHGQQNRTWVGYSLSSTPVGTSVGASADPVTTNKQRVVKLV